MNSLTRILLEDILEIKNQDYIVYFDIDDTLTDYSNRLGNMIITDLETGEKRPIKATDTVNNIEFWTSAKWLPGSKQMLDFAKNNFSNVEILSAVPELSKANKELTGKRFFDDPIDGKIEWLNKNVGKIKTVWTKSGKEKAIYATPKTILVDDKPENIKAFEQAGGIGILMDTPQNVINKLNDLLEGKDMVKEGIIEDTKGKLKKFIIAVKQEGQETRAAVGLVIKSAKGEITLTDEQKKQIGEQLKDILKLVGLTAIATLPGGFIVGALIKLFKAEHLITPSSMMNEDIDPLEATTFVGSVQTIVDGKRDVGYIALKNIPKDEIEQIKTLVSDNNLKILSVKGDQKPIIVYKADKESEAKELKDIAEKYNGYLSIKATEEESRRIGEILGYSKESIDKYIEKHKASNIKEIVTATEVICDNWGWEWPIVDGGDDLYICHKCGHDNNPDLEEASDPQAGTALPYGSGFAPVKENDPFGLNELARQFMDETLKEMWKPEESFVSLSKYMIDNGMNIKPLPKIKVISDDKDNASNLLGKTAYYNPAEKSITLYTMDRHPKDILRSFAHEMVHHEQNLDGRLNNINTTNTNEDGALPEIEREAYEKGNMMLRNWEDNIKDVQINRSI